MFTFLYKYNSLLTDGAKKLGLQLVWDSEEFKKLGFNPEELKVAELVVEQLIGEYFKNTEHGPTKKVAFYPF